MTIGSPVTRIRQMSDALEPLRPTTGATYYVDSGHAAASANNTGLSPDHPLTTIDAAVGKCTANNGDIIIVAPGHTETVSAAAGLDLDVAGITIVGLGSGSLRPTITFDTATTADMDVGAANITVKNLLFVAGIDALVAPIDINAADFTLIDCETRDVTGSYQTVDWIVTDANADRLKILGHVHRGATDAGAATWLSIIGGDDIYIQPRWVDGNFSVACIENVTTAAVNLTICGSAANPCFLRNRHSADVLCTNVATTTGNVGPFIYGRLADDAANITESFVGADMQFFDPIYVCNADGERGLQLNITASADSA